METKTNIVLSHRSRLHGSRQRDQYILVEGTGVRAEGATVETASVCYPLQRDGSVSQVHAGDTRWALAEFLTYTDTHTYNCWLVILLSERLADSLRLPQVIPSIQAQVFLCFRVLLLRMSPQHATSLWPVIVSELVQVFLYIEQELNTDSEEFRYANSSDSCCFMNIEQTRFMGRYCFVLCMVYCSFCVYAIGYFIWGGISRIYHFVSFVYLFFSFLFLFSFRNCIVASTRVRRRDQ